MKKILAVYTGGTICSAQSAEKRELSVRTARRVLLAEFSRCGSEYSPLADELLVDSCFPHNECVLSENMTPKKLFAIAEHILSFDLSLYCGVVILHGTDTLAYSASFFSFLLSSLDIPVMLVSGAKPPSEEGTNAVANLSCAIELIMEGIAPSVYVPYRNSDGVMRLYLGSRILQCANFGSDFFASDAEAFSEVSDKERVLDFASAYSASRQGIARFIEKNRDKEIETRKKGEQKGVLLLDPYVGLDYSRISLDGIFAVLHGTYHSGTLCVERSSPDSEYSSHSVLFLTDECKKRGIPVFCAPCALDSAQYSSAYDACENGGVVPLNMTKESAYAKLLLALYIGIEGECLLEFMKSNIANEQIT